MNAAEALAAGLALIHREARLLDTQAWDEWLALYADDCVYWVPAWDGEHRLTDNPDTEISLIYYEGRAGLEDRIWRIRSGKSVASTPMPRTVHVVGGVELLDAKTLTLELCASWTTHVYRVKRKEHQVHCGRYEYTLKRPDSDSEWKIGRKKVTLVNDTVPTMVDIYCL